MRKSSRGGQIPAGRGVAIVAREPLQEVNGESRQEAGREASGGSMNRLLKSRAARTALIPFLLAASAATCGSATGNPDVNRPIAQVEVKRAPSPIRLEIVRIFARKNRFAVAEEMDAAQGELEFHMELFRDDISVSIGKLRGDPITVTANPLCVCEMGRRLGLQEAADAAVRELGDDISRG
jgi:hypothetical protein